MKSTSLKEEVIIEFSEFMDSSMNPPDELSNNVKSYISTQLNPNPWMVFSKLSFLHLIGGMITLSFCPQFGVSIFGNDYGLTKYLFKLGPYGCTFACGAIFIGITMALASTFMTKEEIKKIKQHFSLQLLSIALLSLGSFLMLNAEILLSFGIAWIFGGLIGGMAILETGVFMRRSIFTF
jgi:hypothetical protein